MIITSVQSNPLTSAYAYVHIVLFTKNSSIKPIITNAICQLIKIDEGIRAFQVGMKNLKSLLFEYESVQSLFGFSSVYSAKFIAEISDIDKSDSKKTLVGFSGIDAPPYQSNTINIGSRSISKCIPADPCKTLFQIMQFMLKNSSENDSVCQILDKERSEGKPYKVYMIALPASSCEFNTHR